MLQFANITKRCCILQLELLQVSSLAKYAHSGMKYQQDRSQKQKQDEEFLQWLSPSYWLVEGQLYSVREKRGKGTLQWAVDMPEFHNWQMSELGHSSKDRILWIRGTLGIGKSIMAGYFIDLLKCQYPNAIVAYFFCRSGQAGLTKAREIIRTLAYQCIENNKLARSALESLKSQDFPISENMKVGFLFNKLLLDPLSGSEKEVYFVLDGLDEADLTSPDDPDGLGSSEMEVLLNCLITVPSSRLLCISRPTANISGIIPNTTTKAIGKTENSEDIDSYVTKAVAESERLQTHFKNEGIDPLKYFRDKGNGIFLWVVLVLQQLAKAKSKSVFQKYLQGFSQASGSMEKLYQSILSRVDREDQKWIMEIIRWMVVAERQLTAKELRGVVEWCLEDKLADFQAFLEVECGSILYLMPIGPDDPGVQLVHETFRSFIVNEERCPRSFLINEVESHGHLAIKCLQRLSTGDETFVGNYGLEEWVQHLAKATDASQSNQLLISLHGFFSSEGVGMWVSSSQDKWVRPDDWYPFSLEAPSLAWEPILTWLQNCKIDKSKENRATIALPTKMDNELEAAMAWQLDVLNKPSTLQEAIGKAAARIWLYNDLNSFRAVRRSFTIALRSYWDRDSRSLNSRDELKALTETEFRDISVWAGIDEQRPLKKKNLGLALFIVQKWDECIRYLSTEENTTIDSFEISEYLGLAFHASRRYVQAVTTFKKVLGKIPSTRDYLLEVYMSMRDYEGAISLFETDLKAPSERVSSALLEAYNATNNYDRAMKIRPWISDSYVSTEWYEFLFEVYKANGDYDGGFEMLKTVVENDKSYSNLAGWYRVFDARRAIGDYDGAIKIIEDALRSSGSPWWLMTLADTYMQKGNYDEAIKVLEEGNIDIINVHSEWLVDVVLKSFIGKRDYDGAIEMLRSLTRDAEAVVVWYGLMDVYTMKGDHDGAIKIFDTAMARKEIIQNPTELYRRGLQAFNANGEFDRAIQRFGDMGSSSSEQRSALWYDMLEAYRGKSDYDGATRKFEELLNLHPTEPWLWTGLGLAYKAKMDFDGALKVFQSAVEQISIDYSFYKHIGDIHFIQSNYKEAVDAYIRAMDMSPRSSFLWAYINVRPTEPFLGRFSGAIDGDLVDAFLWSSLGKAHKANGNPKAANEIYQAVIAGYKAAMDMRLNDLVWQYSPATGGIVSLDMFGENSPYQNHSFGWL